MDNYHMPIVTVSRTGGHVIITRGPGKVVSFPVPARTAKLVASEIGGAIADAYMFGKDEWSNDRDRGDSLDPDESGEQRQAFKE